MYLLNKYKINKINVGVYVDFNQRSTWLWTNRTNLHWYCELITIYTRRPKKCPSAWKCSSTCGASKGFLHIGQGMFPSNALWTNWATHVAQKAWLHGVDTIFLRSVTSRHRGQRSRSSSSPYRRIRREECIRARPDRFNCIRTWTLGGSRCQLFCFVFPPNSVKRIQLQAGQFTSSGEGSWTVTYTHVGLNVSKGVQSGIKYECGNDCKIGQRCRA